MLMEVCCCYSSVVFHVTCGLRVDRNIVEAIIIVQTMISTVSIVNNVISLSMS